MPTDFNTPVGRIVWGNPAKSSVKKDQQTKQPVMRDGKQVEQWVFGVAFTKAEFDQFVMPYLQAEAASVFPNGVPPQFSWKFKDGDGVDRQGKPYADREGYAGHYVLTVSTEAYAPPIFKNENGAYRQIQPEEIKTGDFVVVSLSVKANAPTNPSHTPGIYVNPVGIEHVAYGTEIVGTSANPEEMFGGATYQLPPGASATPVATATGAAAPYQTPGQQPMPGMPAQAAPAAPAPQTAPTAAPVYQQPPATPQAAPVPQQHPAPAHDFVNNAVGQQPAAQPAAAPMPQAAPAAPAPQAAPVYAAQPQPAPGQQPMPGMPVQPGQVAG